MAIRDIFKVSRKTFFNPGVWLDVDGLKDFNRTLADSITGLFVVPALGHKETFEEAVKRLKLSQKEIEDTQQTYFLYAIVFVALGIGTAIFTLYLLFIHYSFYSLMIGIPVAGLFLAQAFKYHFWYFQIKHRKLGCSFAEWRNGKPRNSHHA